MTKVCKRCGIDKNLSCFHRGTSKYKRQLWCKECFLARNAELISNNRCPQHVKELLIPGKMRCGICREIDKKKFSEQKSKGLCTSHANEPALPGQTKCQKCKDYQIFRSYGITKEEYDLMFKNQNYSCEICKSPTPGRKGWCMDHRHTINFKKLKPKKKKTFVRGILCQYCNSILGLCKENKDILVSCIKYLTEFDKLGSGGYSKSVEEASKTEIKKDIKNAR
jgi:Recombination endonuclease VII